MATDTTKVESAERTVVGVTGASGYIAGVCIGRLIAAGYHVRGSVRSLSNTAKVQHLQRDFGPNLELFEADLLKPGSFDEGLKGCKYVLHTASPFQLEVKDAQTDLVDPALKGTENVLRAAAKAGVTRVVVTSSVAAVISQAKPPAGTVWTEDNWNSDSTLTAGAYRLSKSLAEKKAWELSKELSLDVVTINPAFVLGPPTSLRVDSTSVKFIKRLLDGTMTEVSNGCFGCVDVQDVAEAHVQAMRNPNAKGRYIVSSSRGHSNLEMANFLRKRKEFQGYSIPSKESAPIVYRPMFSNEKLERELGISLAADSVEHAVVATARFLINNGVVKAIPSPPESGTATGSADLEKRYLMLLPDKGAAGVVPGPTFWPTLDDRRELAGGYLMCKFSIPGASDGGHWEIHPNGDEILTVLSGKMTLRLERGGTVVEDIVIGAGQTGVVPSGVWHRQIFQEATTYIGLTPGTGTRHRPL